MPRAPHASIPWIAAMLVLFGLACLPAAVARTLPELADDDGDAAGESPDTGKDDTGADPFV
jgi:hypothetical protein